MFIINERMGKLSNFLAPSLYSSSRGDNLEFHAKYLILHFLTSMFFKCTVNKNNIKIKQKKRGIKKND